MVAADFTPCTPWADPENFTLCEPGDIRPETLADAVAVSTAILYVKTGRAFPGTCDDTWRPPCRCGCGRPYSGCVCSRFPSVELRSQPVLEVTEVMVDGAVLPDDAWLLGDPVDPLTAGRLYRVDGELWPVCQDLSLATSESGTWQISYTWGALPPAGADLMCERLACEYVKQWTSGRCALNGQFTTITRENLTATVIPDPGSLIANGQTGIRDVDLWITSINPGGADRQPKILTPEMLGMDCDPTARRRGAGHVGSGW